MSIVTDKAALEELAEKSRKFAEEKLAKKGKDEKSNDSSFLEELMLLAPSPIPIVETIGGQELTFSRPFPHHFIQAMPHLQELFFRIRDLAEDEGIDPVSQAKDGNLLQMLLTSGLAWNAPTIARDILKATCSIIDAFQEKEIGYTSKTFYEEDILKMVRNYYRVIPAKEMGSFFVGMMGAVKGVAANPKK